MAARILVVEDDRALRTVLVGALQSGGFEVEQAADVFALGRVRLQQDGSQHHREHHRRHRDRRLFQLVPPHHATSLAQKATG